MRIDKSLNKNIDTFRSSGGCHPPKK